MSVHHCSIDALPQTLGSAPYHFIASATYEERAFGVWQVVRAGNGGRRIVFYNANLSYIERHVGRIRDEDPAAEIFQLNSDDPAATFSAVRVAIDSLSSEPCRIVIDVTGFTREVIAMLIYLTRHRLAPGSSVRFAYHKAKTYGQSLAGGWLSQGVREIRTILGYAGLVRLSAGSHLILLGGFEFDRAQSIVEALQPRRISFGQVEDTNAVSSSFNLQLKAFLQRLEALHARRQTFDRLSFSSVDPSLTCDEILRCKRYDDCNTVVACLNTKMAMIGASLAALHDQTLQLIYAQPLLYNVTSYSEPSGQALVFSMSPGPVG